MCLVFQMQVDWLSTFNQIILNLLLKQIVTNWEKVLISTHWTILILESNVPCVCFTYFTFEIQAKKYNHMILSYYWHRFHTSDPLRTDSFIHPTHTLNWRLLIILQGCFFSFNHSDHWIYKYPCSTWKSSLATTVLKRTLVQDNPSALSNVFGSWRIKIQINCVLQADC